MKEFWNERYGQSEYAYGTEPNVFFKDQLDKLVVKGDLLMPAEGEGRNAVYAAIQGWKVTAFDMSEEAKTKALQLATTNNTELDYHVGVLEELHLAENSFEAIGLVFAHFPTHLRSAYHKQFVELLKPGGLIILEGFSKEQLNYNSGGPRKMEMLFSLEEIREDFAGLEVVELTEQEIELSEGPFHQGKASVIRFVGRKPVN